MKIIEPHIHMIARTTQDYLRMAMMHTVACCEPAFWAGYDRTSPRAFHDYFTHISTFEPTRAAQYGIQHYCWICVNPKEAEDLGLAREVLAGIGEYADHERQRQLAAHRILAVITLVVAGHDHQPVGRVVCISLNV